VKAMAGENKDQSKPISSGVEPGPTEHRRDDMAQSAGSSSVGSPSVGNPSVGSPLTAGNSTGATTSASAGADLTGAGRTGSSSMGAGSTTDRMKESTSGMAQTAKQYAGDIASRAKDKSRTLFDQQKESAVGQVGSVASAIRNTASNLQGEGQDQTARYVNMIADQLESIGGRLREKDLDTLLQDAQNYARRSPGVFLAGSVVAGFLLARFLKSSSSERQYDRMSMRDQDQRTIASGEAGPYVGVAGTSRNVSADGTPGTAGGVRTTATGPNGQNIGGGVL